MWDIVTIKGIVLVVMFIITFVCSMLPIMFVKRIRETHDSGLRFKYHMVLSMMSCSAGGVFMGTCILDLFPDVQEQLDLLMDQNSSMSSFPIAEFIIVFGFLLVLTMEQIVLDYKESKLLSRAPEAQSLLSEPNERRRNLQQQHSISGISDQPDLSASMRSETGSLGASHGYGTAADHCEPGDGHTHNHLFEHSIHHDIASHSSLRSLLLLFALSLHSIFEGLAIGLQDTIDDVVGLFLVVIFHKAIIALSLGLNMVQSKLSVSQMLMANMFFCVTSPLGVGIGMGIMEMQASFTTAAISGTLQGIACGTFLYVTFFEVLPHEMNNGENRLMKLMFIIFGFSAVCGVQYLDPDIRRPRCFQPPLPVEPPTPIPQL
ncbi:zinc transporter ZIP1 [Procambarus clarkii]|uniref:zinc transporter ZIP1 n=1 Tax=Procambarus clarkii TaxID=6728 RepID=UPI001E6714AE|nr:zinc transporter ZIP1-like [Procambarus clarkii]XP_045601578.1 zinc transporter ZIP1-like [Procambarus clarkii]XP_045601580.1 zinc transporter ZIP1-like [Procambarus clarkii]XP_045601581.1 zinc transporter ZIP1-like [Procambarus clarkii]